MTSKSLQSIDIMAFQKDLLNWYDKNKRDLPWRQTKDPYKIWVSEVMLQQTQVKTVIPYYERFMENFPTVYDLAEADEQFVLKEWEGLGYYSRARNLHHAAQEVATTYDGKLPKNPKKLEKLKGIGPYTKGAIMSIAFNEREAAVDGNVMRVYSRLLKIADDITQYRTRKLMEELVFETIPKDRPGDFNQSIMELGALICTPRQPKCYECPVQSHCAAYKANRQTELPIRNKQPKKRVIAYDVLLILTPDDEVIIEQRPESGLLANLWQFPMIDIAEIGHEHIKQYMFAEYGLELKLTKEFGQLKHTFTHLIWELTAYKAHLLNDFKDPRLKRVKLSKLENYPFPVSHLKLMDYLPDKN